MNLQKFEPPSNAQKNKYVPLHVLSDYSVGKSIAKIPQLVENAVQQNMSALALTDWNLSAEIYFYRLCTANNIKPVLGQKIKFRSGHVILLCKDFEAYKILCRHSLELQKINENPNGEYKNLPFSIEECCHFVCISSESDFDYAQNFSEDFYVEIPANLPEKAEKILSNLKNQKAVATNEINFIQKEDTEIFDDYKIALTKQNEPSPEKCNPENYFKTESQISEFAARLKRPDLIENTQKIAEKISWIFPENYFEQNQIQKRMQESLPLAELPQNFSSRAEYLKSLVQDGLKKRYGESFSDEIQQRANAELETIISRGWENYFLLVAEIASWCKSQNIAWGPGRGSAPSSIVNYALGITGVEPVSNHLYFERFFNSQKTLFPHIDIGVDFVKFAEIINHLKEKYGADCVSRIQIFPANNSRNAISLAGKALNFPYQKINEIRNEIPFHSNLREIRKNPENSLYNISEKLKTFLKDKSYEKLFDLAEKFSGLIHKNDFYACGYVITKNPIQEYAPAFKDFENGEISVQFTAEIVENCGLVKFDFWGLKTLSLIRLVEESINQHKKTEEPVFSSENISEDDSETFDLFCKGNTDEIFCFESSGMKKNLAEAEPRCIEELAALYALYRPGTMEFIPKYIEGKLNPQSIHYPDLCMKKVLKRTYGIIIYQEQIMEIIHKITNWNLDECDIARRNFGKKNADLIENQRIKFLKSAAQNGFDKNQAALVFENLLKFGCYAFNKSHAISCATLAYREAYLKCHYPEEFKAALEKFSFYDEEYFNPKFS